MVPGRSSAPTPRRTTDTDEIAKTGAAPTMPQPIAAPCSTPSPTADALRAELAPSGLLQSFLVGQVALSMDRLARADAREDCDDPTDAAWGRERAQAERSFYRALTEFRRLAKAEARARAVAEEVGRAPAQVAPPTAPSVEKKFRFADALGPPAGSRSSAVAPPRGPSGDLVGVEPRRGPVAPSPTAARAG